MHRSILAALTAAAVLVGTKTLAEETFDFRSDERPVYDETVTVTELEAALDDDDVTVLDVRLEEDYAADPQLIPGARYRNPDRITEWASTLSKDEKIVVYCVRGKWVSQKAADYLDREGYDVVSLEGGLEAWKDAQ